MYASHLGTTGARESRQSRQETRPERGKEKGREKTKTVNEAAIPPRGYHLAVGAQSDPIRRKENHVYTAPVDAIERQRRTYISLEDKFVRGGIPFVIHS